MMNKNDIRYDAHYSDASFWQKLGRFARVAGREVAEKALYLYYSAKSPDMPAWARTVVIGALGYFILPTDAMPDIFPLVGFTDDLGALAAALALVMIHITPDVKEKTAARLREWFREESGAPRGEVVDAVN